MQNVTNLGSNSKSLKKIPEIDDIEFSLINDGLGFHHKTEAPIANRARDIAVSAKLSSNLNESSAIVQNDQLSVFYKATESQKIVNTYSDIAASQNSSLQVKWASILAAQLMDLSLTALLYFVVNLIIAITLSSFIDFNTAFTHFLNNNYLLFPVLFIFYNVFSIRISKATLGMKFLSLRFVSFSGREDFLFAVNGAIYLFANTVLLNILHIFAVESLFKVAVVHE